MALGDMHRTSRGCKESSRLVPSEPFVRLELALSLRTNSYLTRFDLTELNLETEADRLFV